MHATRTVLGELLEGLEILDEVSLLLDLDDAEAVAQAIALADLLTVAHVTAQERQHLQGETLVGSETDRWIGVAQKVAQNRNGAGDTNQLSVALLHGERAELAKRRLGDRDVLVGLPEVDHRKSDLGLLCGWCGARTWWRQTSQCEFSERDESDE